MLISCVSCQSNKTPMTYEELLNIPSDNSVIYDRWIAGSFEEYRRHCKSRGGAFVEMECLDLKYYITWREGSIFASNGYTVAKMKITSIGEQFSGYDLKVGDEIDVYMSYFFYLADMTKYLDFYRSHGAVVSSGKIVDCPDEYFEVKLETGENYYLSKGAPVFPLYCGEKYTGYVYTNHNYAGHETVYSISVAYPVDNNSPLLTSENFYSHGDNDLLEWAIEINKIVENSKDKSENVTKTELLPGIEINEQDSVQNVGGKKVLDLSKYITSSAAKKSITLDEVKSIIKLSEKLLREYDTITVDETGLNIRDRIAEKFPGGSVQGIKSASEKNALDSMTARDMFLYIYDVCDLTRSIIFRICDPSVYMMIGEDMERFGWINCITDYDMIIVANDFAEINNLGYSSLLDLSLRSEEDPKEMCGLIISYTDIYYNDTPLFPTEEFIKTYREKRASESAGYPVE